MATWTVARSVEEFGRCSSGVPLAAPGMLTVAEAISFHVETAFGPATVIVTGRSWAASSPPQAESRLTAEMITPMAMPPATDTGRGQTPSHAIEARRRDARAADEWTYRMSKTSLPRPLEGFP